MKCLLLSKIILCVLGSVALSVEECRAQDSDDDDDTGCDAKLADSCFRDVYTNLQCHFKSNSAQDQRCAAKTVDDLCSAINDALDCSSDIVNTDCAKYDGSEKFNRWLRGLRSVHSSLCTGNRESLKNLINNPRCWSITAFISCVEDNMQVQHIVDMLKVEWSVIGAAIAMANCNAKISIPGEHCTSSSGAINEIIHTFLETYGSGCISGSSSGIHFLPNLLVNAMACTLVGYAYLRFNYFMTL